MSHPVSVPARRKAALLAATLCLSVLGPLAGHAPAFAQGAAGSVPQDVLAAAKARLAGSLASGSRVLLVELYGTTLYVFNFNHAVGGPAVRVLEGLGFTSVLPQGVDAGSSGATSVAMETLQATAADHVFFLNFSTSEAQVREVESALRGISNGRLHRLDTTTAEALSASWTEAALVPRMVAAFERSG